MTLNTKKESIDTPPSTLIQDKDNSEGKYCLHATEAQSKRRKLNKNVKNQPDDMNTKNMTNDVTIRRSSKENRTRKLSKEGDTMGDLPESSFGKMFFVKSRSHSKKWEIDEK